MRVERREREEASILHADLDSFYASVEQRDDPALRGRPVLVGGGVVLAASYEAKARGVRSPMPGHEARRLCPDAVVVRPRFDAYMEASREVFDIFHDTTPVVEGTSVDEAFLDVGGLGRVSGSPQDIATTIRSRVRDEVGLPITVGGARSKFLAKVASAVGKPDGLLIVAPGTELSFLHPLPVRRLWGVGPVTEAKLHDAGVETVGDIAALGQRALCSLLGPGAGRHLFALSLAQDPRRVETGKRRHSIGSQRALGRRPKSGADLEATIVAIVERLGKRLRTAERVCRTVVLRLRFDDFTRATRSRTLPEPTDRTDIVMATTPRCSLTRDFVAKMRAMSHCSLRIVARMHQPEYDGVARTRVSIHDASRRHQSRSGDRRGPDALVQPRRRARHPDPAPPASRHQGAGGTRRPGRAVPQWSHRPGGLVRAVHRDPGTGP